MAILSSHTLDSVNGSHAGGVVVTLQRITTDGERTTVLTSATDSGGRFSEEVDLSQANREDSYELVFSSGAYFESHTVASLSPRIVREVVIRFQMPDKDGRYHIPVILAPNSYSVWWSD